MPSGRNTPTLASPTSGPTPAAGPATSLSPTDVVARLLIVSDTAFTRPETDGVREALLGVFRRATINSGGSSYGSAHAGHGGPGAVRWTVGEAKIVPDSVQTIKNTIRGFLNYHQQSVRTPLPQLIVTAGGTGFAEKDRTPEAVASMIDKPAPGLVHAMLAKSLEITPFAMMARPVAGVIHKTVVVTLPGSPKAAAENLEAIIKFLPHACLQAFGMDSRQLHAGGTDRLEREAGVTSTPSRSLEPSLAPPSNTPSSSASQWNSTYRAEEGDVPPRYSTIDLPAVSSPPIEVRADTLSTPMTSPPPSATAPNHSHHHHHHHQPRVQSLGHAIPQPRTRPEDRPPRSNDPAAGPTERHRASPYPMLSVAEALSRILRATPKPKVVEEVVDSALVGSILAADVEALEAVPAFRASIVDGYAINLSDPSVSCKGTFPVVSVSHAAPGEQAPLKSGQLTRITTGAPLPAGANAVVMVEDTVIRERTSDGIEELQVEILTDELEIGENVRDPGSDIAQGEILLRRGDRIDVGAIGLLASVGRANVSIYEKPVVGIMSTGNELVSRAEVGSLRTGQVRDCNRPTLISAMQTWGYRVLDCGIAPDTADDLETSLRSALRACDVVVTSGGVSMGELDLLKPTLERRLGGSILVGRVSMKPGKPTTFATVPIKTNTGKDARRLVFALPGNPASAIVTAALFVLPSLRRASGEPSSRPVAPPSISSSAPTLPPIPSVAEADEEDGSDASASSGSSSTPRRAEDDGELQRLAQADRDWWKGWGLRRATAVLSAEVHCDAVREEYARARLDVDDEGRLSATLTGGQRSSRVGSFRGATGLLVLPSGGGVRPPGDKVETLLLDI